MHGDLQKNQAQLSDFKLIPEKTNSAMIANDFHVQSLFGNIPYI